MSIRNFLKEIVEICGGIVVGALIVIKDVPLISELLRFVAAVNK